MHRDIKPSNIFLKFENDKCITKLGDLGISRHYDDLDSSLQDDEFDADISGNMGTPLYMAPEMIKEGVYNYKIDLYSLGVTLYYLIFDSYPYYGKTEYQLLQDILSNKQLNLTGLESLDNLIRELLKENPDERISFEDYFNHKFFKEKDEVVKNFKIKNENTQNDNEKNIKIEDDINKISNIAQSFIDIMNIPNGKINQKETKVKMANIIYYDENINKHIKSIHSDSDKFERKTPGTFILCSHLLSLNFVMDEIKKKIQNMIIELYLI
jgi:serine/threonine protein kinase